MHQVNKNLYADENGHVTHENAPGRHLLLARGAVVSDDRAKELGLVALAQKANEAAVENARRVSDPVNVAAAALHESQSSAQAPSPMTTDAIANPDAAPVTSDAGPANIAHLLGPAPATGATEAPSVEGSPVVSEPVQANPAEKTEEERRRK